MLEFVRLMWLGTIEAMRLNPQAFAYVHSAEDALWVPLAIAIVGGVSTLLGQSVILLANQVRPARFVFSLLLNGVVFTLDLVIWALVIWLTGRAFFFSQVPFLTVLQLVWLGAAPYVFGFLVLLPYAGSLIGKVLSVWSLLIVVVALTTLTGGDLAPALICALAGWTIITVISATIGRPIINARNALWKRLTGADKQVDVQQLLARITAEEQPPPRTPPPGN